MTTGYARRFRETQRDMTHPLGICVLLAALVMTDKQKLNSDSCSIRWFALEMIEGYPCEISLPKKM